MSFKKIIIFVFIFSTLGLYAQKQDFKKPNYKKIKKITSKKNSGFYYPKLMKRYLESSTDLTLKEKRLIYYGFAFQENYKPYTKPSYRSKINKQLAIPKKIKQNYKDILHLTDLHLLESPFDIEILKVRMYLFKMLRLPYEVLKVKHQIAIIKDVLLSSGNGLTENTAFNVIYINHEYDLLTMLGYKQKGIRQSINKYEYLKLEPNKNNVRGLYFNLVQGLKSVNNKIKPKKKRFF